MRLGLDRIGRWITGAPQAASTALTLASYLALWGTDPAAAARVRRPFSGGTEAATAALYPALAGRAPSETVVWPITLGAYKIALDGYGILPYWKNATWEQKANEPDRLVFDYPADADHGTALTRPGIIRLYDSLGAFIQVFRLSDLLPSVRRDSNGTTVKVSARGLMGDLDETTVSYYGPIRRRPRELVTDYLAWRGSATRTDIQRANRLQDTYSQLIDWATGYTIGDSAHTGFIDLIAQCDPGWIVYLDESPWVSLSPAADALMDALGVEVAAQDHKDTIPNHIAALMAEFNPEGAVTLGPLFDPLDGETVTATIEARSLLDAMHELYKLSGQTGHYTVTPKSELVWLPTFGGDGTHVSVGFNLRSLERHCDTSDVATVLTLYGQGLGADTRLRSTASANTGAYGSIARTLWIDEATTQADLDTYAAALVAVLSVPVVDYSINAVDLHSLGVGPLIALGSYIHVTDSDLQIESQQWLVGITRRLDDPLNITFQFAKEKRDLPAIVRAINARIDRLERRDDDGRIAQAIRDGRLPSVRDGNRIDGDPRQTDLRVNDGLEYFDGQDWQALPTNDPNGEPKPGDTRKDPETGELQHYNGETWNGPGAPVKAIEIENADGVSDDYARADHVHAGVPIMMTGGEGNPSVPETPCLLFVTDEDNMPSMLLAALWDTETSAMVWQRISHLDEEPAA